MKCTIPYQVILFLLIVVLSAYGCIKNDYSKKDIITLYNNFSLDIKETYDLGTTLPTISVSMLPSVNCSHAEMKYFVTQEYHKICIDIQEVMIPENCNDTIMRLSKSIKLAPFEKENTEFCLTVDDLISVQGQIEEYDSYYRFTLEKTKYATIKHETIRKLKPGMTWGRVSFSVDSLRDSIAYVIEEIEQQFPEFKTEDGHYSFFDITRGQINAFSLYDDRFPYTRSFIVDLNNIKHLNNIFEKYRKKHKDYIKLVSRNWKDEEI